MNAPGNPYVAGTQMRSEQDFFGRQRILDWAASSLRGSGAPPLVLFGQRGMGKTWLLRHLERVLPADAFLAVYFDLRDWTVSALGPVLAGLAGAIARRANLQPPGAHLFDDQGRFFLQTFLPRFRAVALRGGRRLVLLLDEFEVLSETAEVALPAVTAVKALYPFLLDLVGEGSPIAPVFAAGRRADDLPLDLDAGFEGMMVQEVGCLDWESAAALTRRAEVNGTLHFSDLAVARILDLTNCHPYWTQLLCQRIWERAQAENPVEAPLIDTSAVEEALPDALAEGDSALAWRWDGLGRAEKIYAATLAEAAGEGVALPVDRVVRTVAQRAARLCVPEVELAPRHLVRRQVLKESGERGREGECAFAAEFFRLWVRQNWPLESIAGDLGPIDPSSERAFEIGVEYFGRWEWEGAIHHFREALEANPSHARARRYLGEALLEMGRIDDAVGELRRAHALDAEEAELSLARALAAQARARERETPPVQMEAAQPGAGQGAVIPSSGHAAPTAGGVPTAGAAAAAGSREAAVAVDGAESAPLSGTEAVTLHVRRWLLQVGEALGAVRIGEALRLVSPVLFAPTLSALAFYVIGVSLARGMSGVTWLPALFGPSTFYRFGLISAALGLIPGFRFCYEFIRHPVLDLELVYLSFSRYGVPFLAVGMVYAALALVAWISQTSVPEEEWEGFWIVLGWIRRLWE